MALDEIQFGGVADMDKFQGLVTAAIRYIHSPPENRLARFCATVCQALNCAGCFVFNNKAQTIVRFHVINRDDGGADLMNELTSLLTVYSAPAPSVLRLGADTDGRPIILARSEQTHLVVYGTPSQLAFRDQDAQVLAAVWRSCNSMDAEQSWLEAPQTIEKTRLSPRVRQVLHGLLKGFTDKQIARQLGISHHTVHLYVKDLYRRLSVTSRAQLFVKCRELGKPQLSPAE